MNKSKKKQIIQYLILFILFFILSILIIPQKTYAITCNTGDTSQSGNQTGINSSISFDKDDLKTSGESDTNNLDWSQDKISDHLASSNTYPPFSDTIEFEKVNSDGTTSEISNMGSAGTYISIDPNSTKLVVINIDSAPTALDIARYGRVGWVITDKKVTRTEDLINRAGTSVVFDEKQSYYFLHLDSEEEFKNTTIPANTPVSEASAAKAALTFNQAITGADILANTSDSRVQNIKNNLSNVEIPVGVYKNGNLQTQYSEDEYGFKFNSNSFESESKTVSLNGQLHSMNVMEVDYTRFREFFGAEASGDLTLYISPIYILTNPHWDTCVNGHSINLPTTAPTTKEEYVSNLLDYYQISTCYQNADSSGNKQFTQYQTFEDKRANGDLFNSYNIPITIPNSLYTLTYIEVTDKEKGVYNKLFSISSTEGLNGINQNFMALSKSGDTLNLGFALMYSDIKRTSVLPSTSSEVRYTDYALANYKDDTKVSVLGYWITEGGGTEDINEYGENSITLAQVLTSNGVQFARGDMELELVDLGLDKLRGFSANDISTYSDLITSSTGTIYSIAELGNSLGVSSDGIKTAPSSSPVIDVKKETPCVGIWTGDVYSNRLKDAHYYDLLTVGDVKGNCHIYVFVEKQEVQEPSFFFKYTDASGKTIWEVIPTDYNKQVANLNNGELKTITGTLQGRAESDGDIYKSLQTIAPLTKKFQGTSYTLTNINYGTFNLSTVPLTTAFTKVKVDDKELDWDDFNLTVTKETQKLNKTLDLTIYDKDLNYGSIDNSGNIFPFNFNSGQASTNIYVFEYTSATVDVLYVDNDTNKVVQKDVIGKSEKFEPSVPSGYAYNGSDAGYVIKESLSFNISQGQEYSNTGYVDFIFPGNTLKTGQISDMTKHYIIRVEIKKEEPKIIPPDTYSIGSEYLTQRFNTKNLDINKYVLAWLDDTTLRDNFLAAHPTASEECGDLECTDIHDSDCDDDTCTGCHSHDADCYCSTIPKHNSYATIIEESKNWNWSTDREKILSEFNTTILEKSKKLLTYTYNETNALTASTPSEMSTLTTGTRWLTQFDWVSHRYSPDGFKGTFALFKSSENTKAFNILNEFENLGGYEESLTPDRASYKTAQGDIISFNMHSDKANELEGWKYTYACTFYDDCPEGDGASCTHDSDEHQTKDEGLQNTQKEDNPTKYWNVVANSTYVANQDLEVASDLNINQQVFNLEDDNKVLIYYNTKLNFFPVYKMKVEDLSETVDAYLLGYKERVLNAINKIKIEAINDSTGKTPFTLSSTWDRDETNLTSADIPNMKAGYNYQYVGSNNDSFKIEIISYNVVPKSEALGNLVSETMVDTTVNCATDLQNALTAHTSNVDTIKKQGISYFTNLKNANKNTIGYLSTKTGYAPTVSSTTYMTMSLDDFDSQELSSDLIGTDLNVERLNDQFESEDWYQEEFEEFVVLVQTTALTYQINSSVKSDVYTNNLTNSSNTKNKVEVYFNKYHTIEGKTRIAGCCVGIKGTMLRLKTAGSSDMSVTFELCSNPVYFSVINSMYDDRH